MKKFLIKPIANTFGEFYQVLSYNETYGEYFNEIGDGFPTLKEALNATYEIIKEDEIKSAKIEVINF